MNFAAADGHGGVTNVALIMLGASTEKISAEFNALARKVAHAHVHWQNCLQAREKGLTAPDEIDRNKIYSKAF